MAAVRSHVLTPFVVVVGLVAVGGFVVAGRTVAELRHAASAELPPAPDPAESPALRALRVAEARWRQAKPQAYDFTIDVHCFCLGVDRGPRSFHVTGESWYVSGPTRLSRFDVYSSVSTVEAIFETIRARLRRGHYKVDIDYDPTLGYPKRGTIDPVRRTADGDLEFTVSVFKPVVTPSPGPTVR